MGSNVQQFEQFLNQNLWSPIEAAMELREVNPSIDLVILSHLNAVPEFIAKCQGHRGKDRQQLGCQSGYEYLYVQGIRSLIELDSTPNREMEIKKAKFLYAKLRCEIAHSILAKVIVLAEPPSMDIHLINDDFQDNEFQLMWLFEKIDDKPFKRGDIARLLLYVPAFYQQVKDGVNTYLQNVKEGECELKWQKN